MVLLELLHGFRAGSPAGDNDVVKRQGHKQTNDGDSKTKERIPVEAQRHGFDPAFTVRHTGQRRERVAALAFLHRWCTGIHITVEVSDAGGPVQVGWTEIVDMGLRHFKLDVSAFSVDRSDQAVDQQEHQDQTKPSVNKWPYHVIPTL